MSQLEAKLINLARIGFPAWLAVGVLGWAPLSFARDQVLSTLAGTASVIDGDTIEIRGTRIRLDGFDTPEHGAMCDKVNVYQKAALVLSDFIGERTVTCVLISAEN